MRRDDITGIRRPRWQIEGEAAEFQKTRDCRNQPFVVILLDSIAGTKTLGTEYRVL